MEESQKKVNQTEDTGRNRGGSLFPYSKAGGTAYRGREPRIEEVRLWLSPEASQEKIVK